MSLFRNKIKEVNNQNRRQKLQKQERDHTKALSIFVNNMKNNLRKTEVSEIMFCQSMKVSGIFVTNVTENLQIKVI